MNLRQIRFLILGSTALVVVLAIAWLALHRCGGLAGCDAQALPRGPVTFDQVKSHPEGHLFYPGAHVYWPVGGGEQGGGVEDITNPAFAGAILISSASPSMIDRWYRDWMSAHGWQLDKNVGATVWLSHSDFVRGSRERFTVAIDDPQGLSGVLGTRVPTDRGTVFEVRYQILPAS